MPSTRAFYKAVLSHFPQTGLRLAFAYGSGVFHQLGHKNMKNNMVDFIFAVDNPAKWHKENISRNANHYSFMRIFGSDYISRVQDNLGAHIYFNTLVKCENRRIKYGVISTQSLTRDLIEWETLYVSGRLHKPVYHVIENFGGELAAAIKQNRRSAACVALLLLPDHFTEEEFYYTVAGISYTGDLRMTIGEDKNKVRNIVKPNIERFRDMYGELLGADEYIEWSKEQGRLEQSLCGASRYHHLSQLPLTVLYGLTAQRNLDGRHRDTEEVMRACARNMEYEAMLQTAITDIVKQSSRSQLVKGIASAGIYKSLVYGGQKMYKMYKSKS